MAVAIPIILMVGAGIAAAGAIQQGQAAKAAAKRNAAIADRNGAISRDLALRDANAQTKEGRRRIGSMRAGYAASGVTLEGSPMDVIEDSAASIELDRLNILYKGELAALGYSDESESATMRGKQAQTESYFRASSALMQGAGSAYGGGGAGTPMVTEQVPGQYSTVNRQYG